MYTENNKPEDIIRNFKSIRELDCSSGNCNAVFQVDENAMQTMMAGAVRNEGGDSNYNGMSEGLEDRSPVNVNVILGSGNTHSTPFTYTEQPYVAPMVQPLVQQPMVQPMVQPFINNQQPLIFVQTRDGIVPMTQEEYINIQQDIRVIPTPKPPIIINPPVENIVVNQDEEECYFECFYPEFP